MSISITAANATYADKKVYQQKYVNVFTIPEDQDGTLTAGTLTFRCKAPKSKDYETPSPAAVIDLAAPQRLEVQGKIDLVEITVAGIAGTATNIKIDVDCTNPSGDA